MDHLPEWADFPCPLGLQEEPSLGEKDEESRFTPRADKSYQTSDQAAGYYFKQSSWGYNHLLNYESLDTPSAIFRRPTPARVSTTFAPTVAPRDRSTLTSSAAMN
jgi:hypothetical protein